MSNKLWFSNPGEVDIQAITTLGVNVKDAEHPIGHFGTGVKYAIAGVLRLGGSITIWSGFRQYKFVAEPMTVREKIFHRIYMKEMDKEICLESQALGFTTDLGKDWEPWMIYRELRANAEDEGGEVFSGLDLPEDGKTVVEVDCEAIWQAHQNRGSFWIEDEPLWVGAGVGIFPGQTSSLFYHGIKATAPNANLTADWTFHYSINKDMKLTEDRTFASFYDAKIAIAEALLQCDSREVLEAIFNAGAAEIGLDFDRWGVDPSDMFIRVVLERLEAKLKVPLSARNKVREHNPQETAEAELDIPSRWEDMERLQPGEALEVKASYYDWKTQMEERMEALEKSAKFWRACARKLAGQPAEPTEVKDESVF